MNERILAIDYGTKRIGLALTDPLQITAQPFKVLPNDEQIISSLAEIIKEKNVGTIVLGQPLNMNGSSGGAVEYVGGFAKQLREKFPNNPLVLWDERLTTKEAERLQIEAGLKRQRRRETIDALAATLLLQYYLQGRVKK